MGYRRLIVTVVLTAVLAAQAAADGEVKIVLKSPVRDGRITRTDFRGLKINGREMFRGERAFSVMHPYEYTTKIKKRGNASTGV